MEGTMLARGVLNRQLPHVPVRVRKPSLLETISFLLHSGQLSSHDRRLIHPSPSWLANSKGVGSG